MTDERANPYRPLHGIVQTYLSVHKWISFRSLVFGRNPDEPPEWLRSRERGNSRFRRDFFVDLYAVFWPAVSIAVLYWIATPSAMATNPLALALVGFLVVLRLNELLGGITYVLLERARKDVADGRKLLISLLAYVEPILLFAILHGVIYAVVVQDSPGAKVYELAGRDWRAATVFHYSVGCYTTVGWGDVSAVHPFAMFASDVESITGILMLALTLSRFVSAALDRDMNESHDEQPSGDAEPGKGTHR